MTTQATIGYIDPETKAVFTVDLVNDGDLAGQILLENYNTLNAAKVLVEQGTISILKPRMQDCIFHTQWGREKRVNRGTADLLWMAKYYKELQGDSSEDSPMFIFDSISFINDYEKMTDLHYHTMYGHKSDIDPDTSYWLYIDRDGIHKVRSAQEETE